MGATVEGHVVKLEELRGYSIFNMHVNNGFLKSELTRLFQLATGRVIVENNVLRSGGILLVDCSNETAIPGHAIIPKLADEEYRIDVDAGSGTVIVAGGGARGMLYGVYALLEAAGLYFAAPGDAGVMAAADTPRAVAVPLSGKPRFAGRSVMFTVGFSGASADDCLDFLSRLRINKIFHYFDQPGWKTLTGEASSRYLKTEVGGHFLNALLPRGEYERPSRVIPEQGRVEQSQVRGPQRLLQQCRRGRVHVRQGRRAGPWDIQRRDIISGRTTYLAEAGADVRPASI